MAALATTPTGVPPILIRFQIIEGERERHDGAADEIRHGGRHGRADVRAELLGGDGHKHRPVADAETEEEDDEIKRRGGESGGKKIREPSPPSVNRMKAKMIFLRERNCWLKKPLANPPNVMPR